MTDVKIIVVALGIETIKHEMNCFLMISTEEGFGTTSLNGYPFDNIKILSISYILYKATSGFKLLLYFINNKYPFLSLFS